MATRRTTALVVLGIVCGAIAVPVLGAVFTPAPGDAGKVSDGVHLQAPDGLDVTLTGTTNMTGGDVFPDSRTVQLNTSVGGNITLAADSSAAATIDVSEIEGTWTNVTGVSAGGTWIEVNPADKQRVDVRGDTDELAIRAMALDDSTADFVINGTNGGTGTVKIYSLPANTQISAVETGTGKFLATAQSDANGNLTLDIGLSSHTVSLKNADDNSTPTQSNPDPTGVISDTPADLSIDVNDSDFADNGDNVTAEFYLDGSKIDTQYTEQNATLTTTNVPNTLDLGGHDWAVNTTDEYGNVNNQSYDFSLPSNITLRKESNASQIITNKNITAKFYPQGTTSDVVVERSDSNQDGNISLRGLPDTSFVVSFSGNGYHDRRAFIDSIGAQKNIYLLNSSRYPLSNDSAIATQFVYEDRTSQFERSNTTLQLERAVDPDGDGNFTYQVVAGDFWGAAGEFPFTGQYQERYRLIVTNRETGESRRVGTHIPRADGTKQIIIGQIIFDAANATGRYADAGINQNTSNLQVYYQDPANGTRDLTITVHEAGNASNELLNETIAGPVGEVTRTVTLSDAQTGTNWVVEFDGDHDSDGSVFLRVITGGGSGYNLPIDGDLGASFGLIMVTFIASLYGPRTARMGSWALVGMVAILMFFQFISLPVVSITVAAVIAAGGSIYREAIPA